MCIAGWINHDRQLISEYLQEEGPDSPKGRELQFNRARHPENLTSE